MSEEEDWLATWVRQQREEGRELPEIADLLDRTGQAAAAENVREQATRETAQKAGDPDELNPEYNRIRSPLESDAAMASALAHEALHGYCWAGRSLDWRRYNKSTGTWQQVPEETISEQVRKWMLSRSAFALRMAAGAAGRSQDPGFWTAAADSWRKHSTASRIASLSRLARGICLIEASRFDCYPDLLNCPNGVLDLRTGKLDEHDPDLLLTQVTGAEYHPDAQHADVDKALQAIPGEAREYAQLRMGQGLTGYKPPDDAIDVQHGAGSNGKTTVMLLTRRAGGDYVATLPHKVLLANPDDHTTELMTLRGVRTGILEELPEEHSLSVQRLKMTTAPEITARFVHKDNVTFSNACSLIISTNYRPQIRETDHGTWRRLEGSIPFPYTFRKPHESIRDETDRRGDPGLRERIETEPADGPRARAMLAWLAEGARAWYEGEPAPRPPGGKVTAWKREPRTMGQPPQLVRDDIQAWRESCDLVYGFLADEVTFDPDAHVLTSDLLEEFNRWAHGRGHREWSAETLAGRLAAHSEIKEHRVTKKRLRPGQEGGLSRPPGQAQMALATQYQAWLGLRFSENETTGQNGSVQGVQGLGKVLYEEGHPFIVSGSPAHPAQDHLQHDFAALWKIADFRAI